MSKSAVAFRNVSKDFGSVRALVNFSHDFAAGQVHALMGRNGSGKSTVAKMIGGVIEPTTGEILVGDRPVHFQSPRDAKAAGIATVYQELSLVPSLTIAENLFLGDLTWGRRKNIFVDWKRINQLASEHLKRIGVDLDPQALVAKLSVGQQQILEIAKAMHAAPSILIFDEATSALAQSEVEQVFTLIRELKRQHVTMLYVTHRMSEIFEIADTCTVLRDGHFISSAPMADLTHRDVVHEMFGAMEVAHKPTRPNLRDAPVRLSVKGLQRKNAYQDIDLTVKKGEILGIAGILGSGRTEILRGIFGADPPDSGEVSVDGISVRPSSPQQMKAIGIGFTPENRKEVGLVQSQSSHANLCMASLGRLARRGGFIHERHERPHVERQVTNLFIKTGSLKDPVSTLSGGNQQKIVVGKWLNSAPKILLLDEPTRGIDVQAKRQIFDIIWQEAREGLGIIFVSSELEEILEVTDRVIMLRHGRIVGEAQTADITLEDLYAICLGDAKHEA